MSTATICRHVVLESVRDPTANTSLHSLPDNSKPASWVALARHLHSLEPYDAVASFSELDQDKAAAIAQALGLPWHSPDTIASVHNKLLMRERLSQAGLTETYFTEVQSADEVIAAADANGWPLVLKPVSGWASAGVTILTGPEGVAAAWDRAVNAEIHQDKALMVETFLPGREFSVESLSEGSDHLIIAVTAKITDPTTRVELGHVIPAELPAATWTLIEERVRVFLTTLGVRDGIAHTEVILTSTGAVELVETHVRPPGDYILDLVEDFCGIDVISAAIRQIQGESVLAELRTQLAVAKKNGAAIQFIASAASGTVTGVRGVEEVRELPFVREVGVSTVIGDLVAPPANSFGRLGYVRSVASTGAEAYRYAQEALNMLYIQID